MKNEFEDKEQSIAKKFGFKVINHTLEFFGWCKKCSEEVNEKN